MRYVDESKRNSLTQSQRGCGNRISQKRQNGTVILPAPVVTDQTSSQVEKTTLLPLWGRNQAGSPIADIDHGTSNRKANSRIDLSESASLAKTSGPNRSFGTFGGTKNDRSAPKQRLLETQARARKSTCVDCAIFDIKERRKFLGPFLVCRWTVLPRVSFNSGNPWDPRSKAARVKERCSRAG